MQVQHIPFYCLAAMVIASVAAYAFLPAIVAVHWDLTLNADGFAGRGTAIAIMPAIGAVLILMQMIGRRIAATGDAGFSRAVIIATPILLVAHLGIIGAGLWAAHLG